MQNKEEKQEIDKRIGKRFKELIRSRGLTQQQIADEVHLSKQSISNICSGHQDITPNVWRFADLLGVSTDYLLCRSDYKTMEEMMNDLAGEYTEQDYRHDNIQNYIVKICEEKGFHFVMEAPITAFTKNGVPVFFSTEIEPRTRGKLTEEEKSKGILFKTDLRAYSEMLEDIEDYINLKLQLLYKRSTHGKIDPSQFREEVHPIRDKFRQLYDRP